RVGCGGRWRGSLRREAVGGSGTTQASVRVLHAESLHRIHESSDDLRRAGNGRLTHAAGVSVFRAYSQARRRLGWRYRRGAAWRGIIGERYANGVARGRGRGCLASMALEAVDG